MQHGRELATLKNPVGIHLRLKPLLIVKQRRQPMLDLDCELLFYGAQLSGDVSTNQSPLRPVGPACLQIFELRDEPLLFIHKVGRIAVQKLL